MNARGLRGVFIAATALTGCTVGPNYHSPMVAAPPAFVEASSTPNAVQSRSDLTAWWLAFNDPVLNELIRRGLADNLDLKSAESRVREARLQIKAAAAAELPSINATGNALTFSSNRKPSSATGGGLQIPSHLNLYTAGFDASWEIDLFGGTRRSIEAAKASADASEWSRRDGQVSLTAEIANDYLTLRALQTRIAIGEAELQRQKDLFGLIHARRQAGFTTELDVNQQSTQVATAAAQIPQLRAQARAQMHALAVLIGQTPGYSIATLSTPSTTPLVAPPSLPVGLPSDLLRRRPDIREAERQVAQANAQIGVREADLFPKLNLLGLASFASNSPGQLFSAQNFSSGALGMLTQPIFDGGRARANIKIAKAEHEQALLAYRGAVLGAFRDVEDALVRYTADNARHAQLADAVTAARNSLKIAEDQYRVGVVSFINVLQAQNAVLTSRDQLAQSDASSLSDLVSLYKALGGGWTA